jgi:lysophospholipase L1-like esterase
MISQLLRWRRKLCLFAAALALLPAALPAATQIHISPTGNDASPGTVASPVRTPQGAQVLVHSLIQSGLTDSVEVVFAAGTYVMDAPLELRPEDSGTAAFPITWKAATGATVILDGGKRITSTWTNAGGGIWHTDLAGIGPGMGQWNFRELFVNGSRATRARFPNKSVANPYLYATGGSTAHVMIDPVLVKAAWGAAADAQINVVPQSRFFNQWNTVTAVNTTNGRIDIADSERHRTIDSGSWFWIEGVEAELDEPGEWFLNPATGRLYYMPPPGVDPNTLNIVAPFLNRIVNAKGDVNANTHVKHVHFDGLEFRHTTFTLGHIEARVHTDTVIMFENTLDSSVRNCRFENIGGYGLWLHLDSQRNVFDRNTVQHSGGGGVLMTGARLAYMDDSKIYTPGAAAAKVAPILNEVTRNTVEHCGKVRYYGGGVHMDSRPFSMSMSPGNRIANNHFSDLSRNGVFAFRNQGGNVVEYNRIHNAMQTTIDGGCIHFATMNHLNAPNHILNNWLYDIWGFEQKADSNVVRRLANGIFLDWDTSNTTVRDNWIYNSVGGSVKTIWDNWNLVVINNPSSATPITPPFVAEVGPDGTATHGINLAANKLTGSVIHYTQSENFSTSGTWTQETAVGIVGLFEFNFLTGTAATPSLAIYTLPISEAGKYQISLLYKPGSDRASNVPIAIAHAGGTANVTWNMRAGSSHGFAVAVGTWQFTPGGTNTITLSTAGTDGKVIADSVAFVKIDENLPPQATNAQVTGTVTIGSTLTASYAYSDTESDPEGATLLRWYRSNDNVLDAGDTAIAGAFTVTPVAWKQSSSYGNDRRASLLSNGAGMNTTASVLYNLDGSRPGEPTSANGISWMTSGNGDISAAVAAGRVWIVADLGASYPLNGLRIWNWQWNLNGTTDLSDRGVNQFDIFVRNSAADTSDGTAGGMPINLDNPADNAADALNDDAVFNPGTSNVWQLAHTDQFLKRAPNTDTHAGGRFTLTGHTARFIALRVDGYYGGDAIGLGKARIDVGQSTLTYQPVAADAGRFIICEVIPVAASGTAVGLPATAIVGPVAGGSDAPPVASAVTITGNAIVGASLTGNYSYFDAAGDAQSGTVVQWYRSSDSVLDGTDILTGSTTNYTVQAADLGKFLFFRVTPGAATGTSPGAPVVSAAMLVSDTAKFVRNLASGTPQRIVLYGTSLTANGAWVSQLQTAVQLAYPGLATWINSGGSGMASDWGVTNLQTKVINQNPDAVFIEFSMNDAAETLNVSRAQAVANLTTMVNGIRAAHPNCEIILQLMNPADWQPGDTFNVRANLALYQQDYRNFAAANGLRCIDHMPAFMALLDKGSPAYRVFVPDGIHPSAAGWSLFMTPTLLQALGIPTQAAVTPTTIIDNSDPAPAMVLNGAWTTSSANSGFHGTNYLHDGNAGKGTKSAVFTPSIPEANTYPVFLRWTSDPNRATNVPVTVNHSGGSEVISINQRLAGGVWNKLGDFPFAAGDSGNVTIGTDGTGGYVVVDALGIGVGEAGPPEVRLRMDNARAAEPMRPGGAPRRSSIIVWLHAPAVADLTINLTYPAATAAVGVDYQALPNTITIPAGKLSASLDLTPLADLLDEGNETFRVAAAPGSGYVLGSPVEASIIIEDYTAVVVAESFAGAATALNGRTADVFSPLIISAGGSSTWAAASGFLQSGAAGGGNGSAFLNLGSFINSARGTPEGKFELTATLFQTTGTWLSLGFATQNSPSTLKNFTNTGTGTTNTGAGTIIYRAQTGVVSPNANGELDMFGFSNQNAVDGPDGNTGPRTVTITLDLTPGGGYNGTNNFGTVTWSDSVLGTIGSFTYTTSRDFGSILISGANPFTGAITNLSLKQVFPEPPALTFESWISGFGLDPADQDLLDDPDHDGLSNGIEHVLGSNPNSISSGFAEITAAASSLTFRHPLNPNLAENITFAYEWSTDLSAWHSSGQTNAGGTRATLASSPPDANGIVTVVITITEGPGAKLFVRLVAGIAP